MELSRETVTPIVIITFVGVFIGFLSPFGMDDEPLHLSIVYWVLVCVTGYFIYAPFISVVERYLVTVYQYRLARMAIAVLLASAIFSLIVPMLTWAIFNYQTDYRTQYMSIFTKALVIGSALTAVGYVYEYIKAQHFRLVETEMQAQAIKNQLEQPENESLQQFIALLPIEKRGELICLEMSDHYVKVYTDKGHHMLLMRFKDAMEKLANFNGLQTHRSWWVALDKVTTLAKEGRKQFLVMNNEIKVPISKTYENAVKKANIH